MGNPLITIIVPCYNQAHYLPETLNSLIAQSFDNWESIIVDDGSIDNTAIISELYCENDSRFKYIFKQNGGLSSARNYGLEYAKGEFIQFLDSDDVITPERFSNINFTIPAVDIYYSKFLIAPNNNINQTKPLDGIYTKLKTENYYREILLNWETQLSIPIHCYLFRRLFLTKNNLKFDIQLPAKEDWDFILQASKLKPKWQFIDEYNVVYRQSPDSMSRNIEKMLLGTIKVIYKQYNYNKYAATLALSYKLMRFIINSRHKVSPSFKEYLKVKSQIKYKICTLNFRAHLMLPFVFLKKIICNDKLR